nr:hypothetical protein Hi04_10k_c2476_00013 [uncultured bacterium]
MKSSFIGRVVITSLLFVVLTSNLTAQTTASGGLTGTVADPSNHLVPGAIVELKDNAKGTLQSTKTDAEGAYVFSFLLPGSYTLKVSYPGFTTDAVPVNVLLGPPGTLHVKLAIAPVATTIQVKTRAPLINTDNGDASTTFTERQVSEIPNPGNDLTYIAQTAPGVVMNTDTVGPEITVGNFSSLGMPGYSNLFTVNGMNSNDMGFSVNMTGASFLFLGQNQIQEATVVTNGYSGQFGLFAGANVNYLTKSGGNELHGNAVYYWNGRAFNANNWFNNANDIPRPFDNANQWATSLGGPFKKDKLFFFLDTEGLELLIPSSPIRVVLPSAQFQAATTANIDSAFGASSASDAFYKKMFNLYNNARGASHATPGVPGDPLGCGGFKGPNGLGTTVPCAVSFESTLSNQPTHEFLTSGRVDWNIGSKDRVFLLVQYDVGLQPTFTDVISPAFNAKSDRPWWQGQLVEAHTFNPSVSNQFTLGGYWASLLFKLSNPSLALSTFPTVLNWSNSGLSFTNLGGLDFLIPNGRNITQYQIADDLVAARGRHRLGFGEYLLRDNWTKPFPASNLVGTLSPLTLDAFYQGGFDPASPTVDFTQLSQTFVSSRRQHFAFYDLALYAQDEWHLRSNLTLTFTLRTEHQSNPTCLEHCFARFAGPFDSISHDPDQPYNQAILTSQSRAYVKLNNILWLPRIGFAWQPFGVSHSTVIRGGVGIFYDPLPGSLFPPFSLNPPLINSFQIVGNNLSPNETTSLFKDAASSNTAFVNGFFAGETLAQIQAKIPQFFPPAFINPGRSTDSPQYQKWNLQLQQAFGTGTTLSIGYFGHHGIHVPFHNDSANAWGFGPFPSALCTSPPIPPCADPRFSEVSELRTVGVSNYNGLVVSLQHRFGQGIIQANYTYGHALDEISNGGGAFPFTSASATEPQNPFNIRESYGPSEYDARHSFNASYVWQLPVKRLLRGHGPEYLVEGWQVAGTIFARTGFPYAVFDGLEASILQSNNFFGPVYAVPVGPIASGGQCGSGAAFPPASSPCQSPQILADGTTPNPGARFVQAGCETNFNTGNLPGPLGPCSGPSVQFSQGRNRFRGPSYFNTDFSITKNTKIPGWESATLGIGFQFFNFFNHPNFGFPDNQIQDPSFGQISYLAAPPTSVLGGVGGDNAPRMIQLKAQLQF